MLTTMMEVAMAGKMTEVDYRLERPEFAENCDFSNLLLDDLFASEGAVKRRGRCVGGTTMIDVCRAC